ncbi:hypothetical protein SUGI_0319200 [Cryptomeria japonica]|uniref:squamosa promoter-binding-like protein 3 n=1 Tax=Cryptomeria japonica TaxID=3369 RepID=UPI002408A98B|nr:squamosa promoter-binding-like protein 3 [Cryptomeria japonica]GLJ18084.1 hypothetical protein SUGI_0319200 [Cryptomeria japonica]
MESKDFKSSKVGFLGLRNQLGRRDSQEVILDKTQGDKSSSSNPLGNDTSSSTTTHLRKPSVFTSHISSSCVASGSKPVDGREVNKETKQNCAQSVVDGSGASGDCDIGLKLGKRTYFEDTNGGGAAKAVTQASVSPVSSVQSKKSRALAQAIQTPRCQVEGCDKELTNAKEYHRRHKVCEEHSKTAKVRVSGIEQRFCQQCSRFHELMEFDEGKRSCRRRLAGHNERRRKPQPDPMAMTPARLLPPFHHDNRHGNYLDKPFFLHPSISSTSILGDPCDYKHGHGQRPWTRFIKTEDQSTYDGHLQIPSVDQQSYSGSERLLLSLQNPKNLPSNVLNQGYSQYIQSSGSPLGHTLTLSSSPGTDLISGSELTPSIHNLSGVSYSGRALSLLSSPPSWASRPSVSVSLNMATRSGVSLDDFIHNQSPMTQPSMQGLQHSYDFVDDKLLSISPQSPTSLVSSGFSATGATSINKDRHVGAVAPNTGGIGNFGSQMSGLLQGSEIRDSQCLSPKDVRCTINLLRKTSSGQINQSQGVTRIGQQGSGQVSEFESMRAYEPSMFFSQQMM